MKPTLLAPAAAMALSLAAIALSQPASAAVLYDNGPLNGTIGGFSLVSGAVSDSFTLTSASTVTGVDFAVLIEADDPISTVDWAITSTQNSYPAGVAATVTNGPTTFTGTGFVIGTDSFSTGAVTLAAGTYYLVLSDAVVSPLGGNVFWDDNNGPSYASDSNLGDLAGAKVPGTNSETFQILGATVAAVPEPATWAMMLVGLFGLGAVLRTRRTRSPLAA